MSKKTIVCLCWHPGSVLPVSAGGFTRFHEIAKRATHPLIIIDKHLSSYVSLSDASHTIIQYQIPDLTRFPSILSAILDRVLSLLLILKHLLMIPIGSYTIYVPTSELPQLSLAGVLGKFLLGSKLVLVNLNVNVYSIDSFLNRLLHLFADRVITISHDLKLALAANGIRAKLVNGVGFDTTPYLSTRVIKKQPLAVYIGRHDPQKGIFDLLSIWARIVRTLPHLPGLHLTTAGNIPDIYANQIQALVKSLGIQKQVTFLGSVSQEKKIALLSKAKVCLFPSLHEGWGIVPMESLASGTPVVAYNLPVYQESIGTTAGLKLVEVGDQSAFSSAAVDILNKPSLKFTWKPTRNWDDIAKQEWNLVCQP